MISANSISTHLRAKGQFRHKITWMLLASMVGGLTLVLSIGPSLQTWVVGLVASDRATIYDRVYQDALIGPLSFQTWIEYAEQVPFVLMAAAIISFSLTAQKPRRIALHLVVCTTTVLSLNDLIGGLRTSSLTTADMLVNITCNFFGSFAVAAWIVITLKISQFLILKMARDRALSRALALLTPIIFGLLTTAITFEASKVLFAPVPIRIYANLRPGAAALYTRDTDQFDSSGNSGEQTSKSKEKSNPFNPFVVDHVQGRFQIQSPSSPLGLSWVHPAGNEHFDLALYANKDCPNGPGDLPRSSGSGILFRDVHDVRLKSDRGGQFSTIGNQVDDMHVEVNSKDDFRWIILDKGSMKETFQLSEIVSVASAEYSADFDKMSAYFGTYLINVENEVAIPSDRLLSLTVDNDDYKVRFTPLRDSNYRKSRVICEELDVPKLTKNGTQVVQVPDGVTAGFAMAIKPEVLSTFGAAQTRSKFTINGVGGLVTLDNIPNNQLALRNVKGKTSVVVFNGNDVGVKVDDGIQQLDPDDQLQIQGPLNMWFGIDNHLEISGVGKYTYKNQVRYNRTLWEKLDIAYRVAIVPVLFGLVFRMAWLLWKWLKDDEPMQLFERN